MKDDKVPMTYALAKISHDANICFNILYTIFGAFAYVLIYKILKLKPKL